MYSHVKLKESSSSSWQPVIKGVPELAPTLTAERTPYLRLSANSMKQTSKSKLMPKEVQE